jgi:transcriptional regulator with AAA-type ATPase domain
VKKHYGIRKSFVLVDELQSLDALHQEQLLNLGEQIIATRVGNSQPKIEVVRIP